MSGPVLDLTVYHFHHELGDLQVFGTWIGESLEEAEPCLVVMPRYRLGTKPCCVALSAAHLYHEPRKGHRHLLAKAREFNAAMGRADDMKSVHAVATIIYDHLLDLIRIPPKPSTGREFRGEVTITDRDSGKARTVEVHEDV